MVRASKGHTLATLVQHRCSVANDGRRDEAKDRKREWVTPREAMERIREWAPLLDDVPAEPSDEDMKRGGIKKKAVKRFAMEVCLAAFVEQYGWDKKV